MTSPGADVSVRVAWADDAPAIARVQLRAWPMLYGDLVPAGLRVFAVESLAALPTGGRLHRDGLLELLRRHQGP